jgi:hypothetical protein
VNFAGLSGQITAEAYARADADTVLTQLYTSLSATVTGNNSTQTAAVASEASARASADAALSTRTSTLEATVNTGGTANATLQSRIATEEGTRASADTALSGRTTTLESTVNDGVTGLAATRSRVTTAEISLTDVRGQVFGQWAVQVETQSLSGGGTFKKVSGVALIQSGGGGEVFSEFNVAVDRFNIIPSAATGTPISRKPVFTVGTVNAVADIGISGNLFLDGTLTARTLNVSTLSAITASMGTLTAGLIRSSDSKFQVDCDNRRIVIYD